MLMAEKEPEPDVRRRARESRIASDAREKNGRQYRTFFAGCVAKTTMKLRKVSKRDSVLFHL